MLPHQLDAARAALRGPARGLALAAMCATGCSAVAAPPADHRCLPADNFLCGRPRNLAHRGGANLRPENTLGAFSNAVEIGADVLELDVRSTADGVVVVLHDSTVDRTTDGVGQVSRLTAAAIAQLDAGHRFTRDGGATFPERGLGIRVPTLAQVLGGFPAARFSIEIKDHTGTVGPVLALVSSLGLTDRVEIASFADDILAEVRATAPDVLTTMSLAEMVELANLTDADEPTYVLPAPIVQAPVDQLTPAILARAQRLQLVVQVWTVDDEATMADLLARGVDGIITNDPVRLRAVIGALGGP